MTRSTKRRDARAPGEATLDAPVVHSAEGPGKQKRSPSARRCRDFIRRETANAMLDIVNTFVAEAKDGSVPHFNALAKIGGFDQRTAEAPKRRRRSLARQLLDEVERYEAKQAAELAAANAAALRTGNPGPQEMS